MLVCLLDLTAVPSYQCLIIPTPEVKGQRVLVCSV